MMDWKEKYKEHLTVAGNMKGSLDVKTKTEIFQYRIADKFEVKGLYGKTNSIAVLCRCLKCGMVSSILPKEAVRDNAACAVCMGKVKRRVDGIPEHLLEKLPGHVCIRGVSEPYRGVLWLDVDNVERDGLYIIEHKQRDLYTFATMNVGLFNSADEAKLFVGGIHNNSAAREIYYDEVPNLSVPRILWRGWSNCEYGLWQSKYAAIIKYCLEKRFKQKRVFIGYEDYAFHLTPGDLAELAAIEDIESVLDWKL